MNQMFLISNRNEDEDSNDTSGGVGINNISTTSATPAAVTATPTALSQPGISYRYGSPGGLFGDSSIPSTLPAMTKLAGPSAHQYSDWKMKATTYLQTNGLIEVSTLKPSESLELANQIDGGSRSPIQIKALWVRLHSKVYGKC